MGVAWGMKTSASLFLQRYEQDIAGVLGCYDRIVMTGTLLDVSYPAAVRSLLDARGPRCFEESLAPGVELQPRGIAAARIVWRPRMAYQVKT